MKNIGIFTYDFYPIIGGQGRHVYELYKQNQIHKKVNLIIFSPNENNLHNHITIFPEIRKSKLKHVELSIKLNRNFEKFVNKYKLDIVHIHGGPGGLFLFNKLSVPVVYTAHHTYWQQYHYITSQRWKYLFYLLEKRSYELADKIICVSNDTKKVLEQHYNISNKKLEMIPNGINTTKITQIRFKPNNTKEILYLGRIDKRKGVEFLVRTMNLVNLRDANIVLHIVGEGKDKAKLKNFSKVNKLNIFFHGKLSDNELDKLYQRISIQIVPSIFEGFGISVLEGMAKGIPIIATNVDGISSLIKKNGILVSYGNEKELTNSIIRLINNSKLREHLIINSFSVLKNYDINKIYLKLEKFYEQVI